MSVIPALIFPVVTLKKSVFPTIPIHNAFLNSTGALLNREQLLRHRSGHGHGYAFIGVRRA